MTEPHTALRHKLRAAGFAPLPISGKIPRYADWNELIGATDAEIDSWEKGRLAKFRDTGILTRDTPAIDIDIMLAEAAVAVEALARERFEERGWFLTRVGQAPKRAVLLRTDQPFKKIKRVFTAPNGSEHKIEILGDGQQLASFGFHPDTRKPYAWFGGTPGEIARDALPYISATEAQAFVEDATALLESEFGFTVVAAKAEGNGHDTDDGEAHADWRRLIENILAGRDLHDSIRDLAAAVVASGMGDAAAKRLLRSLMQASAVPRDKRWQARFDDIWRAIQSARDRFGKTLGDATDRKGNGASIKTPNHDWYNPDYSILDDRRGHLPEFPIDVLSERWQQFIVLAARGAGTTIAHVVVPLLGIASSLIGTARRVQASRSWTQPMTLWVGVVGFSGSGKTPGIDVTKRATSTVERNSSSEIAKRRRSHAERVEAARAARALWKKEVEEAAKGNLVSLDKYRSAVNAVPPMPAEAADPGEFVAPRLYASDVTIERLAVLLQARPQGMLLISDELSGLFLNMSRYNGGSDREFWLEAWNGGRYTVERMGRLPITVEHLLVGITGGLQPDKLARSFGGDLDGMYARVLFVWPAEPAYQRLTNEIAEDEPELANTLERLANLPGGQGEDGGFAPRAVPLSSDALEMFEAFRQFHSVRKESLDGREREWWAKTPAHVLRLAGTLSFLGWSMAGGPEPKCIEAEFMAAAIRLVRDFFWHHARASLRQIGLSERHADARRVLRWIRAQKRAKVSSEDVRRDALAQTLDGGQTQALLAELVKAGWLGPPKMEKLVGRGRPAYRWPVNPRLFPPPAAENAGIAENGCGR